MRRQATIPGKTALRMRKFLAITRLINVIYKGREIYRITYVFRSNAKPCRLWRARLARIFPLAVGVSLEKQ